MEILDQNSLLVIEQLAEVLYNPPSREAHKSAEAQLKCFSTSTEYVPQCKLILDNSKNPYAQLVASHSLTQLLTDFWNKFSIQERIDLKNYLLHLLANSGLELPHFVSTSLIGLLCRVTKFAWLDEDQNGKYHHQEVLDNIQSFLSASKGHCIIGLKILIQLIEEINQSSGGHLSLSQHRKIATSFRDKALLSNFRTSLETLRNLNVETQDEQDNSIYERGLQLSLKCLTFDFIGTSSPDESSEDIGTVQIPTSWRPLFEDSSTLNLFLNIYCVRSPPYSTSAMECLVQIASVRRSLFSSEEERAKFLNHLMMLITDILRNKTGLEHQDNHHEFCRLLSRLKGNYQLSQLVATDIYQQWINLFAQFTVTSFKAWQWSPNSTFYLLSLWSRLVAAMIYLKGPTPPLLDDFAPQILEVYIISRIESVAVLLSSGDSPEDIFGDGDRIIEQLDTLANLGRCKYGLTTQLISNLFDPLVGSFVESAKNPQNDNQLEVIIGQLTWLVYIIGSIIGGRLGINSSEEHDQLDGELASRVFKLMTVTDQSVINATSLNQQHSILNSEMLQKLEGSFILFIQHFRRVYIGDQSVSSSKVYKRLADLVGLTTHVMVLDVIVNKIMTNLKYWAQSSTIIKKSLALFYDLAVGYSSGKLLVKLELINQLLAFHTSEHFPFLDVPENGRNRTLFYTTLGRLLFLEDNIPKFEDFVVPFSEVLSALLQQNTIESFKNEQVKTALIGIFRDLLGLISSCTNRRSYILFFEWIYPNFTPIIHRVAEIYFDEPSVISIVLKFMSEFVLNKSGRITFDSSSPNGILLFREASQVLVTYGQRILPKEIVRDPYIEKYKGIYLCLTVLARGLSGNYVNFGVFALYGDTALSNALDIALQLCLSVPLQERMAYQKLSKAYFGLVDILLCNHTSAIAELKTSTFVELVSSLKEGLSCLNVGISSQCCSGLDHLISFYLKYQKKKTGQGSLGFTQFNVHISQNPDLFPKLLEQLFNIVLFEECPNQWSMSRPMLTLILMNTQYFEQIKQQITLSQPVAQQPQMLTCFEKLMDQVQHNLEPKNRDKFTQNLTTFRYETKRFIV